MKKKKLPTPKKLKEKADKLMSEYIRRKYANKDGFTRCYTCDSPHPWKEIQNGHFVSRTHLSTRWDEDNCRPQCMACNVWRRGNYDVYSLRLIEEKGVGILEELNRRKNEIKQMKRVDYNELIEDLQEKLKMIDNS